MKGGLSLCAASQRVTHKGPALRREVQLLQGPAALVCIYVGACGDGTWWGRGVVSPFWPPACMVCGCFGGAGHKSALKWGCAVRSGSYGVCMHWEGSRTPVTTPKYSLTRPPGQGVGGLAVPWGGEGGLWEQKANGDPIGTSRGTSEQGLVELWVHGDQRDQSRECVNKSGGAQGWERGTWRKEWGIWC